MSSPFSGDSGTFSDMEMCWSPIQSTASYEWAVDQDRRNWAAHLTDLVIAEDLYKINGKPFNNRWFHSPTDQLVNNAINVVNSGVQLTDWSWFTKLQRVKIDRFTIVQLQQLAEAVPGLTDLEIGSLCVPEGYSEGHEALTAKLDKLERLHLSKILPETAVVTFDAKLLKAVYLGNYTIHQVGFNRSAVTHCEFEKLSAPESNQNRPEFSSLKTLVCHRILDADNLTVLLALINDPTKLPALAELHCNIDGLTSLTARCSFPNLSDRMNKVMWDLATFLRSKPTTLQIYIQGFPFLDLPADLGRFGWSAVGLQRYALDYKPVNHPSRTMCLPSIVHVDYTKLLDLLPVQFTDPFVLKTLSFKLPNLQEVNVDARFRLQANGEPITSTSILPFLQSLRGLRKLVFQQAGLEPEFFTRTLPRIPGLASSLVWLEIQENLARLAPEGAGVHANPANQQYAKIHLIFLRHFKHLRFFYSNLICKKAIASLFESVAQCPITFQLRFGEDASTYSMVVLKKDSMESFQVAFYQYVQDTQGDPTYGTHSLPLLTSLLPTYVAYAKLQHRFDRFYDSVPDPTEAAPPRARKFGENVAEASRAFGSFSSTSLPDQLKEQKQLKRGSILLGGEPVQQRQQKQFKRGDGYGPSPLGSL